MAHGRSAKSTFLKAVLAIGVVVGSAVGVLFLTSRTCARHGAAAPYWRFSVGWLAGNAVVAAAVGAFVRSCSPASHLTAAYAVICFVLQALGLSVALATVRCATDGEQPRAFPPQLLLFVLPAATVPLHCVVSSLGLLRGPLYKALVSFPASVYATAVVALFPFALLLAVLPSGWGHSAPWAVAVALAVCGLVQSACGPSSLADWEAIDIDVAAVRRRFGLPETAAAAAARTVGRSCDENDDDVAAAAYDGGSGGDSGTAPLPGTNRQRHNTGKGVAAAVRRRRAAKGDIRVVRDVPSVRVGDHPSLRSLAASACDGALSPAQSFSAAVAPPSFGAADGSSTAGTARRPLRIVQITDPHLGSMMTVARLRAVCAAAVAARPDVVLLTGDFYTPEAHATLGALEEALAPLAAPELRGRVFACVGNHDLEADEVLALVRAACATVGALLLIDARTVVTIPNVGPVEIVGLNYTRRQGRAAAIGGYFARRAAEMSAAECAEVLATARPLIVMLHDPGAFPFVPTGVGAVVFSGHTHGGHVGLFSLGLRHATAIRLFGGFDNGLWINAGKGRGAGNLLYVHRGQGSRALGGNLVLRLGVPSEHSVMHLLFPGNVPPPATASH